MTISYWDTWSKNPKTEKTKLRVLKKLPTMECTKQLRKILSKIYKPKMKILDFGCASGHYYLELNKLNKKLNYTGYDATKNYIQFAKKNFKENPNTTFKVESLMSKKKRIRDKFDIVYSCNVLLHLPEIDQPIKNLLLRTKKYCIIRTLIDNHTHLSHYLEKETFDKKGNPNYYTYQHTYSYDFIKRVVKKNGNYSVKFLDDEFNPKLINNEYRHITKKTKNGDSTKISNDIQISGSKVFNWKWVIIKKK